MRRSIKLRNEELIEQAQHVNCYMLNSSDQYLLFVLMLVLQTARVQVDEHHEYRGRFSSVSCTIHNQERRNCLRGSYLAQNYKLLATDHLDCAMRCKVFDDGAVLHWQHDVGHGSYKSLFFTFFVLRFEDLSVSETHLRFAH